MIEIEDMVPEVLRPYGQRFISACVIVAPKIENKNFLTVRTLLPGLVPHHSTAVYSEYIV